MSAMEDFKKVLEEIAAKRKELEQFEQQAMELSQKMEPIYQQLSLLQEKKHMVEQAYLMEVEKDISGD